MKYFLNQGRKTVVNLLGGSKRDLGINDFVTTLDWLKILHPPTNLVEWNGETADRDSFSTTPQPHFGACDANWFTLFSNSFGKKLKKNLDFACSMLGKSTSLFSQMVVWWWFTIVKSEKSPFKNPRNYPTAALTKDNESLRTSESDFLATIFPWDEDNRKKYLCIQDWVDWTQEWTLLNIFRNHTKETVSHSGLQLVNQR